jgi:hypothetical protein
LTILFLTLALAIPVASIEIKSGGRIVIEQPKEDLIVSGGRVIVSAPIKGDLIVAGGEVEVLDNVGGDLIATGGRIDLRGDVGRKLIVAGGSVKISGHVEKFVIASGGEVTIAETSKINGDVLVAGGKIENRGVVDGNFTAFGGSFENKGTIIGEQIFKKAKILPPYFSEIFAFGFLILGFLLIRFESSWFERVNAEIKVRGIELMKRILLGFVGIIISGIVIVLLLITIIGIPSALLILAAFVIALLLSNVFVSYTIGETLISSKKQNPYLYLITGFVILFIAFKLPYIGDLIRLITTSLGFAGMVYVLRDWRKSRESRKSIKNIDET